MAIIGIDEVGRGCWAGPLVVAAVRLDQPISGLSDSKDISAKQRDVLEQMLITKLPNNQRTLFSVQAEEIDEIGLSAAMKKACLMAFSSLSKLKTDTVIIDGNINYLAEIPNSISQIKADSTEPSVMAASILAKQYRDRYMQEQAAIYPEFKWEMNVGYGTKAHMEALSIFGVTNLHRKSFKPIKKYVSESGEYRRSKSR